MNLIKDNKKLNKWVVNTNREKIIIEESVSKDKRIINKVFTVGGKLNQIKRAYGINS